MKLLKWILNGFTGSIVLFSVLLFVLRLAGICPYAVLSGSMEPELMTGGMVFTNTRDRIAEEGDIITYRLNEVTVTHRVVRIGQDSYITKGDANQQEDVNPVLPSQIVGTVCFSLPYLGAAASFLQNRACILLILSAAALSVLLESISGKIMKKEKESTKSYRAENHYEN